MDTRRFDQIARLFATRRTRRSAIAGSLGLGSAGLLAARHGTAAQEGTPPAVPDDPHPSANTPARAEFLFVQPFAGGTWTPKAGEEGTYTLTLSGAAANTVYFSDRPERIFGLTPTQRFLDGLGFSPANPPNAALLARSAQSDDEDILVIELLNPVYDPGTGTLTYDARILADYDGEGLKAAARNQADFSFPETFAAGGLFIDDCGALCGHCIIPGEYRRIGAFWIPTCYTGDVCDACNTDFSSAEYGKACAEHFPDDCTYDATAGWNCQVIVSGIGGECM